MGATVLLVPLAHTVRDRPALLWGAAWISLLVCGAAIVLLPPDAAPVVVALLGPVFPGAQLAGALALERGRAPGWILPTALALGMARVAGGDAPWLEPVVSLGLEPLGTLAAAFVVARMTLTARTWTAHAVAPAMIVAAFLDGISAWAISPQAELSALMLGGWFATAVVAGPLQIHLATDRYRTALSRLRHYTDRELRETRDRFRALTEHTFDMVSELDEHERFRYVNPRYREVLGYSAHDMLGKRPADFIHPGDLAAAADFAAEADAAGHAGGLVLRVQHRDGSWRWLENVASSFATRSGERRWVMNSRDVSGRKAREESLERGRERLEATVSDRTAALQESEARFRALADHAPELISEFDANGCYTFANAAFRDLLGRDPESLLGRSPEALIHPDDLEDSRKGLRRALREGTGAGELRRLHRLRHADGDWHWFDNTGRAFRTRSGELRFVSIGRDVSEAMHAEKERAHLQAHMQEVQRLESLGMLAGGIAHDFNNLLAVILGNATLLERHADTGSEASDRLRRIRAAARHAEALTEQMLAYAGQSVSELKPLDLSQVVRDTDDLLRAAVPKTCRLEFELRRDLPAVKGDATQLRQVLVNLVTNAGEALGGEAGHVVVRTATQPADDASLADALGAPERPTGDWVALEVSDDGPGMDEEVRRRVFDPFFTTRESGRGLGLAAVLGIASAHGALLELDSKPGRGSVFRLLLRPTQEAVSQAAPALSERPASSASGLVLVVDDDDAVREVAGALLERAGLQVAFCTGGHEALERIRGGAPPDAVLLDLAMPDLSGAEVARVIRAEHPELPVVIASGYKRDAAVARIDDEVFAFVHKPFEPENLVRTLRDAVAAGRG